MKYIIFLILLLLIPLVIAENNSCKGEICLENVSVKGEIICKNFDWVENISDYIYKQPNVTVGQIDFIEILKERNYWLQDEVYKCKEESDKKPNIYIFYFSIFLTLIMVIWKLYDILSFTSFRKGPPHKTNN